MLARYRTIETKAENVEKMRITFLEDAALRGVREDGHENAWIIAMDKKPEAYKAFDMR